MTDARMPEKWLSDRRLLRLSDAAFRLHVTALMWSVSNRTDGVIDEGDLPLMPCIDTARADELEKAGLWHFDHGRWLILDFAGTQTSSKELEVLDNVRRRDREKKARQRARTKEGQSPGSSPGTVPRDAPPVQDRQGQDRQGQDRLYEEQPPTEYPEWCVSEGCTRPARPSCRTCWNHHDDEEPLCPDCGVQRLTGPWIAAGSCWSCQMTSAA